MTFLLNAVLNDASMMDSLKRDESSGFLSFKKSAIDASNLLDIPCNFDSLLARSHDLHAASLKSRILYSISIGLPDAASPRMHTLTFARPGNGIHVCSNGALSFFIDNSNHSLLFFISMHLDQI